MVQDLRRRPNGTAASVAKADYDEPYLGKGLSSASMLQASPSQAGPAMKLHVPIFYSILPEFLRTLIRYCFKGLAPTWKPRFLIQIGSYLYKFVDESSRAPKGSPLPVEQIDVYLVEDFHNDVDGVDQCDSSDLGNFEGFFCVATLRKRQYFAVPTADDARVWVNTLRQARQDAVTRRMGHARDQPYPFQYFDSIASSLVDSKDRIRTRIQESQIRELELTTMGTGIGGYMPRGHHA